MNSREAEAARYVEAYKNPAYRLGDRRRAHIARHLERIPRGSLLDVSTGRGEVLALARDLGHDPVFGTEAVDYLCNYVDVWPALAHDLPFDDETFDTVTMFDVLEHLIPEDTALACHELKRVARHRVLLTVHNGPSWFNHDGRDLHVNRRASYEVWHQELMQHFAPWTVIRHGAEGSISEMFEVVSDALHRI